MRTVTEQTIVPMVTRALEGIPATLSNIVSQEMST